MSKAAFDKIAEGLHEALEIAKGERKPARLYVPAEIDVKAIRTKVNLTQDAFASTFGFTVHQIHQWEQGRCRPIGAMRAYLLVIDRNPTAVLELLRGKQSGRRKVAVTADSAAAGVRRAYG